MRDDDPAGVRRHGMRYGMRFMGCVTGRGVSWDDDPAGVWYDRTYCRSARRRWRTSRWPRRRHSTAATTPTTRRQMCAQRGWPDSRDLAPTRVLTEHLHTRGLNSARDSGPLGAIVVATGWLPRAGGRGAGQDLVGLAVGGGNESFPPPPPPVHFIGDPPCKTDRVARKQTLPPPAGG